MGSVALLALIAGLGAAGPAPADTLPSEPARSRATPLPSGLSYDEMRRALARLRPVPRPVNGVGGPLDGIVAREVDGLVVDETQTKIGRDFFQVFYGAWEPPHGARNFTVRIQEQPSPSLGTRVVVLLDDEVLFQLQLQPRYEVVEDLGQQAALHTRREIERRQPASLPAAAGDPPGPGDA